MPRSLVIATGRTKSPNQENTQVMMNTTALQKLVDRAEIINAVNIIGMVADLRDWKACRAFNEPHTLTEKQATHSVS